MPRSSRARASEVSTEAGPPRRRRRVRRPEIDVGRGLLDLASIGAITLALVLAGLAIAALAALAV